VRQPIVAGNWKMHGTRSEAAALASAVRDGLTGTTRAEVVFCPPFTALQTVGQAIQGSPVQLGAQDVHWDERGAHTGEISAAMLRDLGCRYVIVGHSERRAAAYDTDESVQRKAAAVLEAGLRPIVCVGETWEQREQELTETVVRTQVEQGLRDLGPGLRETVIAYEPVWAIGTGKTATAEQAQAVHGLIRKVIAGMAGSGVADDMRIQYGGSVKPSNAAELFGRPDVDGGLIGGASLDASAFVSIVRAAT